MRNVFFAVLTGCALAAPSAALAQNVEDEIDRALAGGDAKPAADADAPKARKAKKVDKEGKAMEPEVAPAAEPVAPAPEEAAEELPQIGEDQLAIFVLNRGFYANGDLGIFMTLGGVRGYSNVQPYMAIKAGFDLSDFISVQLALASGYSSGNALSKNDAPGAGGNETVNYGLFMAGAEVVAAIRPTARFAIEPRVGGGIVRINPQPTSPSDISASVPGIAPQVGGGLDLKYLTLLTDFSAGLSLGGVFVIGPNIPAISVAGSVRYTF